MKKNTAKELAAYLDKLDRDPKERAAFAAALFRSIRRANAKRERAARAGLYL